MRARWLAALAGVLGLASGCGGASRPLEPTPPSEVAPETPSESGPDTTAPSLDSSPPAPDLPAPSPPASSANPGHGSEVCAGLMPDMPSPKALEALPGLFNSCEREPAMDGKGNIAYATYSIGYGANLWVTADPEGEPHGEFSGSPSPASWPQTDGFQMVTATCSSVYGAFEFEFHDGRGRLISHQPLGETFNDDCGENEFDDAPDPAGGSVAAWFDAPFAPQSTLLAPYVLKLQRFDAAGQPRFEQITVASWSPTVGGRAVVVGTDLMGRTLVLWNGDDLFGTGTTAGRWFEADGTPATPLFQAQLPPLLEDAHAQVLTPLLGGGLVLQRSGTWTHGFASGDTRAQPAPDWLAARHGRLERVRGGKAYALMPPTPSRLVCDQQVELLAPDGTSCGQLTFTSETCTSGRLILGAEGSVLQQQPLQPENPNRCLVKSWPGILR